MAVDGHLLIIRLRNGYMLHVDATQAFKLERVSEPLFHNKPVVVDGAFSAPGVFAAIAVKRGAPRITDWGIDR